MNYLYLLLADLYLFFIMYVASMNMVRAHAEKKLNGVLWVLCLPFVAISFVIDVLNNITLFSLIFWEIPKELTVTDRLKRNVKGAGWRKSLSCWFGNTILNAFDHTGSHLD